MESTNKIVWINFTLLYKAFGLTAIFWERSSAILHGCRGLLAFRHKSISDVSLIPKGVQVWVFCKPVEFCHTRLHKSFLYVPRIFMLERKTYLTKLAVKLKPSSSLECHLMVRHSDFSFVEIRYCDFCESFLCFEVPSVQTGSCPQDGDIDQNTGWFLVAWLNKKWYAFRSSWEVPPYKFGSHNYNVTSFWLNKTDLLGSFFFYCLTKTRSFF